MESTINSTSINMNMYIKPIQPSNLPIKDISEFPSKQAEAIQKHLKELDKQGKLKDEFLSRYGNNLGKPNSLANYILADFENRKHLFIEWTGIETFSDKHTIAAIGIKLNEVSYGSKRYFLWKCSNSDCKHEWVTIIIVRTNLGNNCPACSPSPSILIIGVNDLETYCNANNKYGQQLKSEFMGLDENNKPISISRISRGSNDKVWWHCSNPDCNHKWLASPNSRTKSNKSSGCPACAKNICIPNKNDLETYCNQHQEFSYILEEFVGIDENNQHIFPSEISKASAKKVLWRCSKCHEIWIASPQGRTGINKTGCPHCNKIGTSFPEQYIYHSLKQLFPNTKNRQKDIIKHYEYDIVIPELMLCIEYSGYGWHADKLDRDQAKEEHCKSNGVQFLQIYAHNGVLEEEDTYTPSQIIYKVNNDKTLHIIQLQQIIKFILEQYSESTLYDKIDFQKSEDEANKIMNKA